MAEQWPWCHTSPELSNPSTSVPNSLKEVEVKPDEAVGSGTAIGKRLKRIGWSQLLLHILHPHSNTSHRTPEPSESPNGMPLQTAIPLKV